MSWSFKRDITEIYNQHKDDFTVTKYYVKVLTYQPKDSMFIDLKIAFLDLKEAEKINKEVLIAEHNYRKLDLPILLKKIKSFSNFYKQDEFQTLM